jgi:anaerobic selenocysteine-containing dehydrogenase
MVMFNGGSNSVMSVGNKDAVAESLKRFDFIFSVDIFLTEFTNFADIVLPDAGYLETAFPGTAIGIFNHPAGLGEWCWSARTPIVKPSGQRRPLWDVLIELCDRLGLLEPMYTIMNAHFDLEGSKYKLDPKVRYTSEEITDRVIKRLWGDDKGLDWYQKHGPVTWKKRVDETYWRHFNKARVPVYFEMFRGTAQKIKPLVDEYGLDMDYRYYSALPEWLPCPSHEVTDPQYDLWSFYYRDTLHTNSFTMENPWLDEASQMNPYSYNITINTETAKKKGIEDGDEVWVETVTGRRVKGRVKVSELIHPEGLGIGACAGHWSSGMPIARGKGVFYNDLLELDLEHADPVSANLDLCAKVKVYKAR